MINRAKRRREKFVSHIEVNENANKSHPIIVVAIVGVVILGFYMLTDFAVQKKNSSLYKDDIVLSEAVIEEDKILAGSAFEVRVEDYYVIFYDTTQFYASDYSSFISEYKQLNKYPLYIVDMNDGMNRAYISDISNPYATSGAELKIAGPTLMKVSSGINESYVEGTTAIKNSLGL